VIIKELTYVHTYCASQTMTPLCLVGLFSTSFPGGFFFLYLLRSFLLLRFGKDVKIVHFLGSTKPWMHQYDPVSGNVTVFGGPAHQHVQGYLKQWWDLFGQTVLPKMTGDYVSTNTHAFSSTLSLSRSFKIHFFPRWEAETFVIPSRAFFPGAWEVP
jgi:hypothetical protein